jgi:hypothetical protein
MQAVGNTCLNVNSRTKKGHAMHSIIPAVLPLAAVGYSLVYMLAGGGVLGAVVIFVVAKFFGK